MFNQGPLLSPDTGAGGDAGGDAKRAPRRRGSRGGRGKARTTAKPAAAAGDATPAAPRARSVPARARRKAPAKPSSLPPVSLDQPPEMPPAYAPPLDQAPQGSPADFSDPRAADPTPEISYGSPIQPAAESPAPPAEGTPPASPPIFTPGPPRVGMRPAIIRPAPGRMSFSTGKTRHQFRPSGAGPATGFRPPRPFAPAAPGSPSDGSPAEFDQQSAAPSLEQPIAPAPPASRSQHPHHRGPLAPIVGGPPLGRVPQNQPRQPNQGQQRGQQGEGGQRGGGGGRGGQQGGQRQQPQQRNDQRGNGGRGGGGRGGGGRGGQQGQRPPQFQRPGQQFDPSPVAPLDSFDAGLPSPLPVPTLELPMPDTVPLSPSPISSSDALRSSPMQPPTDADAAALAPFAEDIEIDESLTPVPLKRREPSGRDMLINVVEGEEVRIAVVRRGLLEELYMERSSTESHIGNIYKGRVTNVEPSIQAAFIDFGIGKNGFLHISDLHPQYFPKKHQPRMPQQRRYPQPRPAAPQNPQAAPRPRGRGRANVGKPRRLPACRRPDAISARFVCRINTATARNARARSDTRCPGNGVRFAAYADRRTFTRAR